MLLFPPDISQVYFRYITRKRIYFVKDLLEQEVVVEKNGKFKFAQDYVFTSPSKAGSVVSGRATNGRTKWKTKDGITLKEIQSASTEGNGEVENTY